MLRSSWIYHWNFGHNLLYKLCLGIDKTARTLFSRFLLGSIMSDAEGNPLLSSRIILAQVLGRVCFPQNHAEIVATLKSKDTSDETQARLECQKPMYISLEFINSN